MVDPVPPTVEEFQPTQGARDDVPQSVERSRGSMQRVLNGLRRHIVSAGLTPGDRLPTQRELVQALAVSGSVIREALMVLQAEHVVDVRHGDGFFVKPYGPDLARAALHPPAASLQLHEDLLTARAAIEGAAAEQACRRATAEDLDDLARIVDTMAASAARNDYRRDLDREFHKTLVRSAHNPFLLQFSAVIAEYFYRRDQEAPFHNPSRAMNNLATRHRELLKALQLRVSTYAVTAVRTHILDELWRREGEPIGTSLPNETPDPQKLNDA